MDKFEIKEKIMKILRKICMALAVAMAMAFLAGCYVIQAQPMKKLKGTYQLTNYTRTPSYTYGDKKPDTINYLEQYGYEDYLVVTGEGKGYYVHKANDTPAYSVEVDLAYEYHEEDSSKVAYVKYKTVLESSYETDNKFGVTSGGLNCSNPGGLHLGIEGLPVTAGYDKNWQKVDNATDLSYVKMKFSNLKEYSYQEWAYNIVLEFGEAKNVGTGEWLHDTNNPYEYYYIAIDPVAKQATTYYALKADLEQKKETSAITLADGTWNTIQIGDLTLTKESSSYTYKTTRTVGDNTYEVGFWKTQGYWTEKSMADTVLAQMQKVLFEVTAYENVATGEPVETPYQYYFIAFDNNLGNAYTYYALKDGLENQFKTDRITYVDGLKKILIGEDEWTNVEGTFTFTRTFTEGEGETAVTYKVELEILQGGWTDLLEADEIVQGLIASKMPATEAE